MRIAYADPPYPGQSKRYYKDHPDFGGEVNHAELIAELELDFPDGWALSTSANALQEVLAVCPTKTPSRTHYHDEESGIRLGIWHNTNAAPCPPLRRWHTWEAVIVRGGRTRQRHPQDLVRDIVACAPRKEFVGAKPPEFCAWLFEFIGLEPSDELIDRFPGSGAVSHAWQSWSSQAQIWSAA